MGQVFFRNPHSLIETRPFSFALARQQKLEQESDKDSKEIMWGILKPRDFTVVKENQSDVVTLNKNSLKKQKVAC